MGSPDDDGDHPRRRRYLLRRYTSHKSRLIGFAVILLLVFLLVLVAGLLAATSSPRTRRSSTLPPTMIVSFEELQDRLDELRGSDTSTMRWFVTPYTRKRQEKSCHQGLPDALAVIMYAEYARQQQNPHASTTLTENAVLACEYATFCLADNPKQRARIVNK